MNDLNNYSYTHFPAQKAVRSGESRQAPLQEIFPPHVVVQNKHSARCVGDYLLSKGARRSNEAVIAKTMLTLDVDEEVDSLNAYKDREVWLAGASKCLADAGIEHLLYSSHSHGRPKEGAFPYFGFRLVIPFATAMTLEDSANLSADFNRLAQEVKKRYHLFGNIMALSQLWYVATVPDEAAREAARYKYVPGKPLDWRSIPFRRAQAQPAPAVVAPYDGPPLKVDPENLRARLEYLATGSGRLALALRFVLHGVVPQPGDVRSRHQDIILPFTLALAKMSEPGEDPEDLLASFEPWLSKLQENFPRGGSLTWYDEALRALTSALTKVTPEDITEREFFKALEARRPRKEIK